MIVLLQYDCSDAAEKPPLIVYGHCAYRLVRNADLLEIRDRFASVEQDAVGIGPVPRLKAASGSRNERQEEAPVVRQKNLIAETSVHKAFDALASFLPGDRTRIRRICGGRRRSALSRRLLNAV